jgi:hypothetical protein
VTDALPITEHWTQTYQLSDATRGWFQPTATQSLRMLDTAGVTAADYVVDAGDGASRLVDELVAQASKPLLSSTHPLIRSASPRSASVNWPAKSGRWSPTCWCEPDLAVLA